MGNCGGRVLVSTRVRRALRRAGPGACRNDRSSGRSCGGPVIEGHRAFSSGRGFALLMPPPLRMPSLAHCRKVGRTARRALWNTPVDWMLTMTRRSSSGRISAGVAVAVFGSLTLIPAAAWASATPVVSGTDVAFSPSTVALSDGFDGAAVSIDLVWGLRSGFLANVDYRMFTDNVDWGRLGELHGERFSPRQVNRTIFISEWDDAVLDRIHEAWRELGGSARGIVFCGTIEHAERMAARITAIGFANAMAICSRSTAGISLTAIDRNRMLLDFADGKVEILCGVDVLNEGVDVPDVNLIAFQRVTHSRRIFVQQLGRGLRLAPGKKNVVVLDFVSDVRRFAAGLELQKGLRADARGEGPPTRVSLGSKVQFMRASRADSEAEAFLAEWLEDIEAVEEAGEDVSVLRFPPELPPSLDLRG